MTTRALAPLALTCVLLAGEVARGDTRVDGIPDECQLQVVECATERDDATRPPPRILSSTFIEGRWTNRAYAPSPDGKTLLVPLVDGIRLLRDGRHGDYPLDLPSGPRQYVWSADSKRVAFWVMAEPLAGQAGAQRVLAVLDVTRLPRARLPRGSKLPYDVVYRPASGAAAHGIAWSHDGQALFVVTTELDLEDEQLYGVVTRARVESSEVAATRRGPSTAKVVQVPGGLDVMSCRDGATSGVLLLGHRSGLQIVGESGENLRRLPGLPSSDRLDVVWSPERRHVRLLLDYRQEVRSPAGDVYRGVYLLELQSPLGTPERLHDGAQVHSLWFSPRGTFATWSTPRGVWFRAPGAKPDDTVFVTIAAAVADADTPPVRGMAWSADETKLAITAGNMLCIYELATKALYRVAELGEADDTFLAQPTWVSGQVVVVSSYEDAAKSGRLRIRDGDPWRRPRGPQEPDPTGGRGSSPGGKPPRK